MKEYQDLHESVSADAQHCSGKEPFNGDRSKTKELLYSRLMRE